MPHIGTAVTVGPSYIVLYVALHGHHFANKLSSLFKNVLFEIWAKTQSIVAGLTRLSRGQSTLFTSQERAPRSIC